MIRLLERDENYWSGWYYKGEFHRCDEFDRHCDCIVHHPEYFNISEAELKSTLEKYNAPVNMGEILDFDNSEDLLKEYSELWADIMDMAYSKGAIRIIVDMQYDKSLCIEVKDIKKHKNMVIDFLMDNHSFLNVSKIKHIFIDDFLDDFEQAFSKNNEMKRSISAADFNSILTELVNL